MSITYYDTAFVQHVSSEDIDTLISIAAKYQMTLGGLCRLGYQAEVQPYRCHLNLPGRMMQELDHLAAAAKVSRSKLVLVACRWILTSEKRKEQLIMILSDEKAKLYPSYDTYKTVISLNCLDTKMQIEQIQQKTGSPRSVVLRTIPQLYKDRSNYTC